MADARGRSGAEESDKVAEVAATCRIHWRFTDVPDARADEMQEELETHLREAVANGRSIENVVGENEIAFADEWAREARTKRGALGWTFEIGWALASGIVFTAAVYHLLRWTLTFQVETAMLAPVMLFGYAAIFFRIRSSASSDRKAEMSKEAGRGLALAAVLLVPTVLAWAITGERNAELFEWSWHYTLAALVVAVVLGPLGKRSVGQK